MSKTAIENFFNSFTHEFRLISGDPVCNLGEKLYIYNKFNLIAFFKSIRKCNDFRRKLWSESSLSNKK